MPYAKAFVAFLVPIVLMPLSYFGIRPDSTVEEALTVLLTAIVSAVVVYAVPNKG